MFFIIVKFNNKECEAYKNISFYNKAFRCTLSMACLIFKYNGEACYIKIILIEC